MSEKLLKKFEKAMKEDSEVDADQLESSFKLTMHGNTKSMQLIKKYKKLKEIFEKG